MCCRGLFIRHIALVRGFGRVSLLSTLNEHHLSWRETMSSLYVMYSQYTQPDTHTLLMMLTVVLLFLQDKQIILRGVIALILNIL